MPWHAGIVQVVSYLVLAGLVGVLIWFVWRGRSEFVIRIEGEQPRPAKGKVPGGFLRELAEICRQQSLSQGTIRGVRTGRNVALRFSSNIPESCRQQIRNVWGFGR